MLIETCLDVLIIPIIYITNAPLCSDLFPDDFKCAHVNPVPKKTYLTKDDPNSYRHMSNLSFLSNVLENVVANRLMSHIYTNDLSSMSQSACKQFYITETVLLKIHNDISLNIDNGKVIALPRLIFLPHLTQLTTTLSLDVYHIGRHTWHSSALDFFIYV